MLYSQTSIEISYLCIKADKILALITFVFFSSRLRIFFTYLRSVNDFINSCLIFDFILRDVISGSRSTSKSSFVEYKYNIIKWNVNSTLPYNGVIQIKSNVSF